PLGAAGALRLVAALRAARFDLTLEFSSYNYGLRYWSGTRRGATMGLPWLWWIRPGAGRAWRRRHAVEHYADVVRRLGIPVADWHLRMYATRAELAARDGLLRAHGVGR